MAINLRFDLMGNQEPPSIILANRNGNKFGRLNVDAKSIDVKALLKTSEFSFTLYKYIDGKLTPHWDKVVDFKTVYCPEWDLWYEIKVELDEATEAVKTVFCTQLGQAELSQIKVYNTEINTEADITRDDYKISILYDENNKDASVFHRIMSKAPHYSIAHIDESLKRIQRSFSFDDTSICDVLDEIEEEVGCLVVYNSNSDKNGMPKRDISIYDLYQHCDDCGHREEFIGNECPKCHSKNIIDGYGEDTTIFVTSDELATEGIQLVTDTDSVKNCFKLEAGDDLMTATIRNCNPNGSDYIWYFSDAVKDDMSKELVDKIESYDELYQDYYNNYQSTLNEDLVDNYNALVDKYKEYYNTNSVCINCDNEGDFENECPSCHSGNILSGKRLQSIDTAIAGYPALMNAYYNTIDFALYLKSGLMPNVEMSDTSAEEQIALLTTSALSPVSVENINTASRSTANSAVLSMAKVIIKPIYKVEIENTDTTDFVDNGNGTKTWTGKFVVTNYSDDTDTATSDYISVTVNGDKETFIKQKIEKALNKENTDDYSISGLFEKEHEEFCNELKKYALNPLLSFYDSCEACIGILMAQGVGDDATSDLYESLYAPYYNKLAAIESEIQLRENEINLIVGVFDDDGDLITEGLQTYIEDCKSQIQEVLNFEKYLGTDLWLEFCAYRREDKYSNSNYVSDGLNNAELFEKANEFIKVAEEEIFKSAELQHSISATLNNLLSHQKFKPLIKYFKTGNWIRVQVDDKVYRLRLLEYSFNYGDLKSISVEFSDVIKIKNGTTDVQDVFAQAASMASSYDAVQRQAKKGDVARGTIDQWLVDGLSAANVQIQNNDSEEVLFTKNGLLARSYSDITETYSPEQLKITHNIMAYTDDNWKTVRQSIGKHNYKYFDEVEGKSVDTTGYGMNADFAIATVVSGSQIIGGDIYSNNYSKTLVDGETITTGSYIDLENGYFSLAGGKLTYDGGDLTIVGEIEVTTAGRIGCWDINGSSIYKDSAAFGDANGMYFGTSGLSLGDKFKVESDGIATMTEANVSGTITASDIIGGTITGTEIKGVDISAGSTLKVGEQKDEDGNIVGYNTWIDNNGVLNIEGANISNNFTAVNGIIGDCEITNASIGNCTITGGSLSMESEDGVTAWISADAGVFNANGVNISGTITATDGHIGSFTIEPIKDENGDTVGGWLYNNEATLGSDNSIYLSAVDMSGTVSNKDADNWRLTVGEHFGVTSDGTAYMSNCEITGGSLRIGAEDSGYYAWISSDGLLNAEGVNISGTITATDGTFSGEIIATEGNIGGLKIKSNGISSENSGALIFNKDGNILSNSITSDTLSVSVIYGNSTIGDTVTETVGYKVTASKTSDGVMDGTTVSDAGIVTVKVKTDIIATRDVSLTIDLQYYNSFWSEYKTERYVCVVNVGKDEATFTAPHIIRKMSSKGSPFYATYTFSEVSSIYASGDFTQPKLNNVTALISKNHFVPNDTDLTLGLASKAWNYAFLTNTSHSSDRKIKDNISNMCYDFSEQLITGLSPKSYTFKTAKTPRVHYGFVAQDVEDLLRALGISTDEVGIVCKSKPSEPDGDDNCYGLNYTDLIAPMVSVIQRLLERVKYLEQKII